MVAWQSMELTHLAWWYTCSTETWRSFFLRIMIHVSTNSYACAGRSILLGHARARLKGAFGQAGHALLM